MTSNGILRVRDRQPREDPHSIRQGRGSHPVPLSCKQSFRMMSQNDLGFFFSCGIGSGGIAARDGLFWIWVCPGLASFFSSKHAVAPEGFHSLYSLKNLRKICRSLTGRPWHYFKRNCPQTFKSISSFK